MTTSSVAKKVTQSQDRVFCQGQMHILRQENLGANKSINDFFKITKICLHLFWPISRACSIIKISFQSTSCLEQQSVLINSNSPLKNYPTSFLFIPKKMSTETDKLLNNLRPPLRIRRRRGCRWYHRRRLDRYRRLGCRCGGWLRWWRCRRIGLRGNLCHFGWSYRGVFGWFTKKWQKKWRISTWKPER